LCDAFIYFLSEVEVHKIISAFQLRQLRRVRHSLDHESVADHGLTHVWHGTLHRLDVPERVAFKLCKCLHRMGPFCLSEICWPISSEAGHRQSLAFSWPWTTCHTTLQPTGWWQLVIPRYSLQADDNLSYHATAYRLMTAGRRSFSCTGLSAWNSVPAFLRDEPWTL